MFAREMSNSNQLILAARLLLILMVASRRQQATATHRASGYTGQPNSGDDDLSQYQIVQANNQEESERSCGRWSRGAQLRLINEEVDQQLAQKVRRKRSGAPVHGGNRFSRNVRLFQEDDHKQTRKQINTVRGFDYHQTSQQGPDRAGPGLVPVGERVIDGRTGGSRNNNNNKEEGDTFKRQKQTTGERIASGAAISNQADGQQTSIVNGRENLPANLAIELAVFYDRALEDRYKDADELDRFIKTIMNQAQRIFKFTSLDIPIELKLVSIASVNSNDQELQQQQLLPPEPERGDVDSYLANFCNWQHAKRERNKRRVWWDHAILLSGIDLFKSTPTGNHSGVLGLGWIGGMCKGNYSCTITEALNFESAFVAAHEIGHTLGIMHDGTKNRCDPNAHIMSERTGAGKVNWSKCSNNYLANSIRRGELRCIESQSQLNSNGHKDPHLDLSQLPPPGQVYGLEAQCKLAFGANYTSFVTTRKPFNTVCKELWCVSGSWAKSAHPALEGSSCSSDGRTGSFCQEGKCEHFVR